MSLRTNLLPDEGTVQPIHNRDMVDSEVKNILPKRISTGLNLSLTCIQNYKYFNAAILIISALCNSMIGVSFATINHEVSSYYDISTQLVSLCALQFLFINPLVSVFANYILDNKGLKLGLSINCVLNIVGVTLRMFINQSFAFVIIGNALSAMGNIFIVNCPARFSAVWFKPSERIIVTSLLTFANAVSGQIGAILSPYFVSKDLTPQQGMIYFQAILISSVMLVNLILFKGLPSKKKNPLDERINSIQISPPTSEQIFPTNLSQISSQSSQQNVPAPYYHPVSPKKQKHTQLKQKKQRHERYINQLKTLFTTKNYILCLLSFMMVGSVLNCFATNVELYILPFGFDSSDAGNLTMVSVVSGLIGAVGSGLIIKKLMKFKQVIIAEILLSIITSSLIVLSLLIKSTWLLFTSVSLFSMLLYPLFPAIGQYCCQFMHPIRESTVMGILVGIAQLFSFATVTFHITKGMLQTMFLEKKTQKNIIVCLMMNVGCYAVAMLAMVFTQQRLKRLREDI